MKIVRAFFPSIIAIVLVVPVSPNYALRELDFGAGGGTGQSTNYNFEGVMGENGTPLSGTTYNGGLGFGFTQMTNVPKAPTLSNPANYYNKLRLVIDPSGNPSDTLFAIAISSDNFTTTQYIKPDRAIAGTLSFSDYQTFTNWGGAGGFDILGLSPSTLYQVKVKAMQGNFTESSFGPSASASTSSMQLTFDLDVAASDLSTNPPYNLDIGTLLAGTVTTATNKIWVSLDTNAESGANVYVASQNAGLRSSSTSYTITSASGDLNALSEGIGLQVSTTTQSSGGPLVSNSPYNTTSNSVGSILTSYQKLFSSTSPLSGGRGSVLLKAKASTATPAKNDYAEILTIISAANF